MAEANKATRITLKDVRLAFPVLFEAKQVNGEGEASFSGASLIRKDHPQLAEIKAAMHAAAVVKWGEAKALEVLKSLQASDRLALHDGDAKSEYDGYAGNFFINARNKIRPLVIGGGPDGKAPLAASDGKPYSGCYVNVILEMWGQDNKYGKRVNASLLGVQFVRDGERLAGGGVAAADDFEPIPQEGQQKAVESGKGAAALF